MTENHKQKGVLERVFAVSPKGKGLLAASCIASVLGMVLSLVPYLSVYFICKYFLLGAAGKHGGIVLWTAVAGGAIIGNMVFTVLGSAGCHAVAFDALYRYRLYVMEHLGRISMGYFSTHTSGHTFVEVPFEQSSESKFIRVDVVSATNISNRVTSS